MLYTDQTPAGQIGLVAGDKPGRALRGFTQEPSFAEAWRIAISLLKQAYEEQVWIASAGEGGSGEISPCAKRTVFTSSEAMGSNIGLQEHSGFKTGWEASGVYAWVRRTSGSSVE